MEQHHFAIVYQDEEKARLVLQAFKKLHQAGHLNLKKTTVIRGGSGGEFVVEASRDLNLINPKYGLAGLAGTVAGFIGAAPLGPAALIMAPFMGAVGTSAALGYDFMQKSVIPDSLLSLTQASMPEGSSAIIIQAEIVNPSMLLKAVANLGSGQLVQPNLNLPLYQQLNKALAANTPV